jgi:hypothetical protein
MTITVTLNTTGAVCVDPLTKVKKRNGITKHKVIWKRGKDQDFEFVTVDIQAGVFEKRENNGTSIIYTDNIKKGSGKVDYPYTVTVKTPDGKTHTGPKPDPKLEGGRAVIRNEA